VRAPVHAGGFSAIAINNTTHVWLAMKAITEIEAQQHVSRGRGFHRALKEEFSGKIK
jgi:hypothetical protein